MEEWMKDRMTPKWTENRRQPSHSDLEVHGEVEKDLSLFIWYRLICLWATTPSALSVLVGMTSGSWDQCVPDLTNQKLSSLSWQRLVHGWAPVSDTRFTPLNFSSHLGSHFFCCWVLCVDRMLNPELLVTVMTTQKYSQHRGHRREEMETKYSDTNLFLDPAVPEAYMGFSVS